MGKAKKDPFGDDYTMHPNGYPRVAPCMTCEQPRDIEFLDIFRDVSIGVCEACAFTIRNYERIRGNEQERRREKRAGRGKKVSNYNRTKTRKV